MDYTNEGKKQGYSKADISKGIKSLKWETWKTEGLPLSQGMALQAVIKNCNVPLKGIKKMALHGIIQFRKGFYGLDVDYKNGNVKIYIADDGINVVPVAMDFTPKEV